MEKLLRYLNPKSVNFDAMPSGGVPSLTAADVCIMMSYAQLSPLQDNLIRLKCFGANSTENIEKFASVLLAKYQDQFNQKDLSSIYHLAVVRVALIEFCKVPANYKPTERSREVLSGFSDSTVRKYLKKHIDAVLDEFKHEYELGEEKIFNQLYKSK
ncbi:hypothetical protein C9426_01020 [Serratia sp. S1B]|nr:hypothetical protein C9426_01020 [Serratia sp. S1B]